VRKLLKCIHLLAAAGFTGGFGVAWIAALGEPASAPAAAAVHELLAATMRWLVLPSLAALALTGLLAIAVHRPFIDAGRVWAKALVGMTAAGVVLISTLGAVDEAAAAAVAAVAAGPTDLPPGTLEPLLRIERVTFAINLALAALATALGVWRPRLALRQGGSGGID